MSPALSMLACAEAEVAGLHDFFVRWFIPPSGQVEDFERCERALHESFGMVAPDGRFHPRAQVIERLRAAQGSMEAGFEIAIEGLSPIWRNEDAILVGYIEVQHRSGSSTRRRSTALFVNAPQAPHGVAWRHLHETWI